MIVPKGIGFVHAIGIIARGNVVFVRVAVADAPDKPLPNAGVRHGLQRVAGFIPAIERTHHRHLLGIRRPSGEIGAFHTSVRGGMSPEFVIQMKV